MPTLRGRQGNQTIPIAILLGVVFIGGAIALSVFAFSRDSSQTTTPRVPEATTSQETLPTNDDLDSVDTLNP